MAQKPFFIGWESEAAPPLRQFTKTRTIVLIVLASVVAVITAVLQQTPSEGTFDFGNVQEFSGVLINDPVPMLIGNDQTTYYLVNTFKHGFSSDLATQHHLQNVTVKGTLIQDDLESMIEVIDNGVTTATTRSAASPPILSDGLPVTIRGEIVDSKCHLGTMNPGRFKPHRACAIRCIEGGIPPILVAQDATGTLAHYLLVGADGEAINQAVLDYVAEPVQVTGLLKTMGDRKVLYADPQLIDRL